jgi:hypothetical protein
MAVGDAVSDIQSISAAAVLSIQPGSGIEWIIHNIGHADNIDLQFYDGTNTLTVATITTGQGLEGNLQLHCTNTKYWRVKNTHASVAKLIGYDGVISKI